MLYGLSTLRRIAKRIAPYAAIASVALGFLYWIFNDGVTKRMEDRHRTLSQLTSERWMYEALSRSLQQGGNISKAIIRASQNHNSPEEKTMSDAQREFSYQTDEIAFAQEFQSDLADLVQYAWRLQGLSEQVDISKSQRERVSKVAHDAEELSESVSKAAAEYRVTFKKVFGADSVSVSSITLEQVRALSASVDAYAKAAKAGGRYLELENALNDESSLMYAVAQRDAEHASNIAAWTTPVGYLVYFLATSIALFGKWTELKSGRPSTTDTGTM
jgi:hypothetical protein